MVKMMATAAGGARDLCLWLDVHYTDGTAHWGTGDARKKCCDGTYDWTKVTGVFRPAKPVAKIEFNALFRGSRTHGTVEFRNMTVERREAKPGEVSRFTPPDLDDLEYAKGRGMNRFNILNIVPEPKDPNTPNFGPASEDRDVWVSMKFKDGTVYYDGLWFEPTAGMK